MSLELDSGVWTALVGEPFAATSADGQALALVLSACQVDRTPEAEEWAKPGGRLPFSLEFHAGDDTLRPQQTFTLTHTEHGEVALFLVPLGPSPRGMRYEAVIT